LSGDRAFGVLRGLNDKNRIYGGGKPPHWRALAAVAVSLSVFGWVLVHAEWEEAGRLAADARPEWLLAAALAVAVLPPLMAWRWQAVLVAQGAGRLPVRGLMKAVMAANLLNTVLPGKAGDLVKALYVREHGGLARGIGGVLLERGVDIGVLGALGLLGYSITGLRWGLWCGLVLLGGSLTGVAVLRWFPLERWLPGAKLKSITTDLRATGRAWCGQPRLVIQTIAGSAAVWTLCGVVLACLARSLDLPLGWARACAVYPPAVMTGMIPVTVGGLGPREAVMTSLLAESVGRAGATVLSLGYTVFTYWLLALLSLAPAWSLIRRASSAGGGGTSSDK
jgi:uncharacterized membrane protein YbhN (UPF0104 family)